MDIDILSLFPEYFTSPFDSSILKKAREKGLLNIKQIQIRDFSKDKHHRVDDRPFGGGPGMVMMPDPLQSAIQSVKKAGSHVIYLSPQGEPLTAKKCGELAKKEHLILVCGHYEGIDERIIEEQIDEEISIGDYVLTNGCAAAIVLVDAVSRFIPGVLGHAESSSEDSFEQGLLDCPHYTKPESFCGKRVPDVLFSGDHAKIAAWRRQAAIEKTKKNRPDLYVRYLAAHEHNRDEAFEQTCSATELGIVLSVTELSRSKAFYRKILGFTIGKETADKVSFKQGVTLIAGSVSRLPLLSLVIKKEELFHQIVRRLMRENSKNNIIFGKSEFQLSFSDPDGHEWMLIFPKGDSENNGCLNSRF